MVRAWAGRCRGGCSVCSRSDGTQEIDCASLDCVGICHCDEAACRGTSGEVGDVQLDAVLEEDGAQLEGTLILSGTRPVVRMNRI